MYCPICECKFMNCDCTSKERELYQENEELEERVMELEALVGVLTEECSMQENAGFYHTKEECLAWAINKVLED